MRTENFSWKSSIHLQIGDLELDMHNNYDFVGVVYDLKVRSVLLEWHLANRESISKTLPSHIKMLLSGVEDFRVSPRVHEIPFTEDNCLSSFGYACDEKWTDGQYWIDGTPEPEWRWSFLFQSGLEIQIGGESASVTFMS